MGRPAFRFRKAAGADLAHLTALLPERLHLDPAIREHLPVLLQRLLAVEAKTWPSIMRRRAN
jgi:hypothetical protein